jgi:hypothetical protein
VQNKLWHDSFRIWEENNWLIFAVKASEAKRNNGLHFYQRRDYVGGSSLRVLCEYQLSKDAVTVFKIEKSF